MRTGVKKFRMIASDPRGHYEFEAEIGKPAFHSDLVPVSTREPAEAVVDHPVTVLKRTFLVSCVNVGNPVACIFVNEFDPDWRTYGRELEKHEAFPEKANIVFVKVIDRENIEIRIWERAAGETAASGTCASGAAVLSAFTGRTERSVSVRSPGGTATVKWRDDDEILLTGRADLAYCGEWPLGH
jgi:diaminopimelate epimerase